MKSARRAAFTLVEVMVASTVLVFGIVTAVTTSQRGLQALWPVRIVHRVEPQIAGRLSIGQEVHALQIARECISNALRHGEARKVLITLTLADGHGVLTVKDDGRGFDPAAVTGQGSGLTNLASRAREMGGTMRLDSAPGRGSAVIITFPLTEVAS